MRGWRSNAACRLTRGWRGNAACRRFLLWCAGCARSLRISRTNVQKACSLPCTSCACSQHANHLLSANASEPDHSAHRRRPRSARAQRLDQVSPSQALDQSRRSRSSFEPARATASLPHCARAGDRGGGRGWRASRRAEGLIPRQNFQPRVLSTRVANAGGELIAHSPIRRRSTPRPRTSAR
jgi:hypothetical protein